jgi:hypothetical protein
MTGAALRLRLLRDLDEAFSRTYCAWPGRPPRWLNDVAAEVEIRFHEAERRERGRERRWRGDDRRPRLHARRRLRAAAAGGGRGLRRLLRYTPDSPLPGGRVTVALVPSGNERVMTGEDWAAWAGEPVEDGPGDDGRG